MISFFKKLFSGTKDYEGQKEKLARGHKKDLKSLAEGKDTNPEILYFLAKNEHPDVRKAVALNQATPVQASSLLAMDKDLDVRLSLAGRLIELLPELSKDRQSQIYAYAVQALGILAQDEVIQIRRALSTALRDYAKAPPAVVSRLARDVEREISEPILRFCVALPDDELLNILAEHPAPWVVSTIASRTNVSTRVSKAVFETEDIEGTSTLINNDTANISVETLEQIIEKAKEYPEWHKPIAMRSELSLALARQLTGFVSEAVLAILAERSDFDPATRQAIADTVKRRMDFAKSDRKDETPEEKLQRFVKEKKLTPSLLQDALSWHEDEFVIMGLSLMSGIHPTIAKKMLSLGAPKPVLALCWKAGIPMRQCVDMQRQLARIPANEVLYAKGGTDYPLPEEELKWQLEFFGVKQ